MEGPVPARAEAQAAQAAYRERGRSGRGPVSLDKHGKLRGEPDRVEGQNNIYDSIPGRRTYSPIWQFNYVIVPRAYKANTLRSEKDLNSGDEIKRSTVFEN